MSFREIKQEIERLSPQEQEQLESFLKARRVAAAPEFRTKVEAAHRRMDGGEAVSAEQLRALLKLPRSAAS
jgi:hypothetical protein